MVRVPTHREPAHPGEMLLEEFLKPMEVSQRELADALHMPYQRVNEIVNARRGITPATALRLAKYFWDHGGLLDEPAAALGSVPSAAGGGRRSHGDSATSAHDSISGLS
jgi:addiction module HigA family antidote